LGGLNGSVLHQIVAADAWDAFIVAEATQVWAVAEDRVLLPVGVRVDPAAIVLKDKRKFIVYYPYIFNGMFFNCGGFFFNLIGHNWTQGPWPSPSSA